MSPKWFANLHGRKNLVQSKGSQQRPILARRRLCIEQLEERVVFSLTPSQLSQAYGFNNIFFPSAGGGLVAGDGSGQTIAVVIPYQQPNLVSDVHTFSQMYGLPDAPITIVNQNGSTASLPALATGIWGLEASLDVEMIHALAPGASILVVEAASNSVFSFFQAVDTARQAGTGSLASLPYTTVVSMSWGFPDFAGDSGGSPFSTPAGKAGVTFVAASGDQGTAGLYPAVDPNVLAVGGTSLTSGASGNYLSESAWSGSNGGFGANAAPAYQQGLQPYGATNTSGMRMAPDVSFDAGTYVSIYDSYDGGWTSVGGTSAGAPAWAALVAIADQGRSLAGLAPLADSQLLTNLYAQYGNGNYQYAFHDITSGSNASYSAGPGYDLVTGLGSPRANVVAALLAGDSLTPTPTGPSGAITSTTPTFQWSAVAGASGYYLTLLDTTTQQTITSNLAVSGTSYTPGTPLTSGHNYQWQVQAFDQYGSLGPASNAIAFNVISASINHAPTGTSKTIATLEDTAYTFSAADFGFSDPNDNPANTLLAVKITTLPVAGMLTDNGVAVTLNQAIAVADITAGKLKFTPATNANGTSYASFTFQVQDNGGVANGGVDTDPVPKTITVNVTAVNDAPVGTSKTIATLEDTAYTFSVADFGFSDPNDNPANTLLAVKITTLPVAGMLTDNGVAVTLNQAIAVADITSGKLKFTPATNANGTSYASFTFQVQDNGGVANGGVDTDPVPKTITVNVSAVNDAPVGTSKTIATLEDTAYTFSAADFGFSDPNDNPANTLLAVKITTLPAAGMLTDNGVAVTLNQAIAVADITSGKLKFTPATNANGTSYASFTFRVQDNGGTANGGFDTDLTSKTITINVTSVNDAPTGISKTVTTLENTTYTFGVGDFGFSDPNDNPANTLSAVKIATLPTAGTLMDNGAAVTVNQAIAVADITGGKLTFTPGTNASGASYASFTFQVQDNGGTANGGVDTDPVPKTITVNVTAAATSFSLWNSSVTPASVDGGDTQSIEVGVKFTANTNGYITGVEFYKSVANTGVHTGSLWNANGQLLATGTFTSETASGWQTLVFSTPVAITAGATYTAGYHSNVGHYAVSRSYFNSPFSSGPLTVLASGGVYAYGAGGLPNQSYQGSNYWVDVVFTTTPPVDNTPPTVTAVTPAGASTGVSTSAAVTVTFSEALNASTVSGSTIQLRDSGNNLVAATVSYNAANQTATLTATSALANSMTYMITIVGGAGGVKDLAGNALATNIFSSFTTMAAVGPTTSLWNSSVTPASVDGGDTQSIEVGVKFTANTNGYITGVEFYKSVANTGVHTGSLWNANGQLLATGTFTSETASGWQTLVFSTPVAITAGATYTAGYHTNSGHYAVSRSYFNSPFSSGPLTVLAGGGVYAYGAGGLPNQSYQGSNYWVDVVFTTTPPVDNTPPTVTAVTPAGASTGVSTSAAVTVTFSEALNASTVSGSTIQLRDSGNNLVAATVSYNAANQTATLTATSALANSMTYMITIVGGAGGVKDLAGNALATNIFSSFTTMAAVGPTTSLWNSSVTPASVDGGDTQSIEVGVKFTANTNGYITGVEFYKSVANTGVHTGSLWNANGQLLATGTFTSETASGWQTLVFSTPVAITAGATYTAGYHTNSGHYAVSRSYFNSPFSSGPLTVLAGGGVYAYGAGGLPNQSYQGSNYWVDVVFSPA